MENSSNSSSTELSDEQLFSIAAFNMQVDNLNTEQLRQLCKDLNEANIKQKVGFLHLLKSAWGL